MNRNAFKAKVTGLFTHEEVILIMAAYDIAKAAHRTQEREAVSQNATTAEKRYFNHPKRIAIAMLDAGIRDAYTICIALLHDSLEDTGIFGNQFTDGYYVAVKDANFRLSRMFNDIVAEDVIALTIPTTNVAVSEFSSNNKCLKFYKEKLRQASVRALLGKLFDRLDNLDTIEVKKRTVAELKLTETAEFYIPLFLERFTQQNTDLEKIGYEKTVELIHLVERKKNLLGMNESTLPVVVKHLDISPLAQKEELAITPYEEVYEEVVPIFKGKNKKRIIPGKKVKFMVENQDCWSGDRSGILIYENGEFMIQTKNTGKVTIGKGYDAYPGTVEEV